MRTLQSPEVPLPDDAALDAAVQAGLRLAAVQASAAWRAEAAASWDRLVDLAVKLLRVPASFVSVVGADHDSYPAQRGLPLAPGEPAMLAGRTFCHYTLALDEMLVIPDTLLDDRLRAVPTVATLGVRAYVGVPLRADGQVIGSFCVMDTAPRQWDALALETIAQLAAAAERELTLRMALERGQAEAARAHVLARQREALVAMVSHDLRTPLQTVQLVGRMLQRRVGAADQALVERLLQATQMMRRLADDLVYERCIGQAPTMPRRTGSAALLQAALDMMAPIAERAGIVLSTESVADLPVMVDDAEMLRVLANLVGNALKYSPAGSRVRLGAHALGDQVVLTVADNGPGMDAADCARAFEPGWQGAAGLTRGDGAGLGLNIVRELVSRQGGSVSLHSLPGLGTQVAVSLPALA